jgi:hypothetical protein
VISKIVFARERAVLIDVREVTDGPTSVPASDSLALIMRKSVTCRCCSPMTPTIAPARQVEDIGWRAPP